MSSFEKLLLVQDQDTAITQLEYRMANMPERAEADELRNQITTVEAEESEIRDERHVLEREQKRIEDEVAMVEEKAASEDVKLYSGSVTGVKELQALQDEIASLKRRQTALEDQIIEVMEAAEPVDARLAEVDERKSNLAAKREEVLKQITIAEAEIEGELEVARAERVKCADGIPSDLLATYDRIRDDVGGIGVARYTAGRCEGCHLKVSAMEADRIKKEPPDAVVTCDSCERLLVR